MLLMFIEEYIEKWEKRIKFIGATFQHTTQVTHCTIYYEIVASNNTDSFVYPFYRDLKY